MEKRFFVLSTLAVAALALVSCTKEQEISIEIEPQGVPFEIVAGTVETKTANDDHHTTWVSGDKINLFHAVHGEATYNNDGQFSANENGASVAFSGTLVSAPASGNTYDWFAVYPYTAAYSTPGGTQTINIPAAQTQSGNNSSAHMSGANCPVGGKVEEVAYDAKPTITMKNLTSIIKVVVTNKYSSAITINSVSVVAPVNINGDFNLNLTGAAPAWTGDGGTKTTTLTVSEGASIAQDNSAAFYLSVKPFTAEAGSQISVVLNTSEGNQTIKTVLPSSFTAYANKIYTFNVSFTNKEVSLAEFKFNDADWIEEKYKALTVSTKLTDDGATNFAVSPITFTWTDGASANQHTMIYVDGSTYQLRVYKAGGSISLTSNSSNIINKIVISGASLGNFTADVGTYSAGNWTGLAQDVKFTASERVDINTITVFYQAATASDYILLFPTSTANAAYNATSTAFNVKSLNLVKADLTVKDALDADADFEFDGSTITITHPANASASPASLSYKVSCAKASVSNQILTINQDGAPANITSLSVGSGKTAKGKVAAVSTKGLVLADDSGAIFVYSNTNETGRTIGDVVEVSGSVEEYNTGYQFSKTGLTIAAASGEITYSTTPTAYVKSNFDAFLAAEHNEFADLISFTGVAKKSGSYYDVIVGGGSTPNVTLYSPLASLMTGVADGDNITVTGYAINITSSKCAVIPTAVTNNETSPKLVYSDITGVSGGGVNDAKLTVEPYRTTGWSAAVTRTGCVLASPAPTTNAACTQITYSVGANPSTSENATGTIVVTFTKAGEDPVAFTINVTQSPNLPSVEWDLTTNSYATSGESTVTWTNSVATMTVTKSGKTNANNYLGGGGNTHTRFYKDHTLEIAPKSGYSVSYIEITALSGYVDGFNVTWANASKSVSGTKITITPTTGTQAVSCTIGAACRATNVKIFYTSTE